MLADEGARPSGSRSEGRYRSLFEHHPHAIFELDPDGNFVDVNPATSRLFGHDAEKLLTMSFADFVVPRDLERAVQACRAGLDRPQLLELAIRRSDGTVVDLDMTAVPVMVGTEVVSIYSIAEDISARNRASRELVLTRRLAAESGAVKADFVARMSHEIRTPLTSILAAVELLGNTEVTSEQEPLVGMLQRAGARLLHLVDNVLDFASIEGGTSPNVAQDVDLIALVRDTVDLVGASARLKGLQLNLRLDPDVPRWINDHPTWTSQILVNLLSNAVAFTETGAVELSVSLTSGPLSTRAILYRVRDSGVGIDREHHDLIFQPFSQAPTGRRPNSTRGAGLGLSIVKQLVAISGGSLALDSTPGVGSTFSVSMPFRPPTSNP